jgi:hypothetical protein
MSIELRSNLAFAAAFLKTCLQNDRAAGSFWNESQ